MTPFYVFFCYVLFFLYNPISSLIRTSFHGLIFFYICTCTFFLMLQLYVTVFFYKVSFLKKEIDTDQKYKVVNELSPLWYYGWGFFCDVLMLF